MIGEGFTAAEALRQKCSLSLLCPDRCYEKSAQTHIAVRLKSGNIGHYDNDLSNLLGHDSL